MSEDMRTFEAPAKAFVAALAAAWVPAAKAKKTSTLGCVRVEVEGSRCTVIGSDSYSLVAAELPLAHPAASSAAWNLRLDAPTVRTLTAAAKTARSATVTVVDHVASITIGGSVVSVPTDDRGYPRWEGLFGPAAVNLAEPVSFSAERLGHVAATAKASRQFLSANDRKTPGNVAATIASAQDPLKPFTFEWPGHEDAAPSVRYLLMPTRLG